MKFVIARSEQIGEKQSPECVLPICVNYINYSKQDATKNKQTFVTLPIEISTPNNNYENTQTPLFNDEWILFLFELNIALDKIANEIKHNTGRTKRNY